MSLTQTQAVMLGMGLMPFQVTTMLISAALVMRTKHLDWAVMLATGSFALAAVISLAVANAHQIDTAGESHDVNPRAVNLLMGYAVAMLVFLFLCCLRLASYESPATRQLRHEIAVAEELALPVTPASAPATDPYDIFNPAAGLAVVVAAVLSGESSGEHVTA